MGVRKIDYDAPGGVLINVHGPTNVDVFMYLNNPGVYYSANGTVVSESLAAQAGYPVEKYAKQRQLRERMKIAQASIESELLLTAEEKKVVREKDGFKVVALGLGRHQVFAPDETLLTPAPIPEEQAFLLLDQLAPEPTTPEPTPNEHVQRNPDPGEDKGHRPSVSSEQRSPKPYKHRPAETSD